jgi:hypothetical protein
MGRDEFPVPKFMIKSVPFASEGEITVLQGDISGRVMIQYFAGLLIMKLYLKVLSSKFLTLKQRIAILRTTSVYFAFLLVALDSRKCETVVAKMACVEMEQRR